MDVVVVVIIDPYFVFSCINHHSQRNLIKFKVTEHCMKNFSPQNSGIQGPQECTLVMPMHSNHWATSIKKTKLQMILLYLIGDNNTDVDNC